MIPDTRITENIKKLKELGMSKNDIKENLIKMGVSSKDSDELIKNSFEEDEKEIVDIEKPVVALSDEKITTVKKKNTEETTSKKKKFTTLEQKEEIPTNFFSDDLNITDSFSTPKFEIPEKKEKKKEALDITKGLDLSALEYNDDTNDKLNFDDYSTPTFNEIKTTESSSTADLWQTGLVTTINTKINEVGIRQKKMEEYLKTKIDSEIDKFRKIQDTNKQLMVEKIEELISEQVSGISSQFTKQLALLKVEQVKINKKTEEIKAEKKETQELLQKIKEIETQSTQIAKASQDNTNKLIATTTVKLNAKIKEINDILALQSKITQGLIKNTQTAVIDEVKKLNDFKENINKQINPQQLYDKLNQLESFKQQLANRYEQRFESVKLEFLKKAKDAFKEEITKELSEINKVKNTIVAKTDPEIITKRLKELNAFEAQLVNAIDEKIMQSLKIYESSVSQQINDKIKAIDIEKKKLEQAQITIDLANEKIKELNMFKDQFIAIIDKNIEKINKAYKDIDGKIKAIEERQKSLI